MKKTIGHALSTCTAAYLLIAVFVLIISIYLNGWSRIDSDVGRSVVSLLTMVLSEFEGWGDFWYLAVLAPWLGSTLVMAIVAHRASGKAGRRQLWAGFSIGIYYVIMLLVFIIGKLAASWGQIDLHAGDAVYLLLLIWPLGGFAVGYLSALITDKIFKFPVTD